MTLPAFTIDLGNGLHLDSTGALSGSIEGRAAFAVEATQVFLQLAQQHAPELVAQAVAQVGRGNAPR
jgi:hypothetical protein